METGNKSHRSRKVAKKDIPLFFPADYSDYRKFDKKEIRLFDKIIRDYQRRFKKAEKIDEYVTVSCKWLRDNLGGRYKRYISRLLAKGCIEVFTGKKGSQPYSNGKNGNAPFCKKYKLAWYLRERVRKGEVIKMTDQISEKTIKRRAAKYEDKTDFENAACKKTHESVGQIDKIDTEGLSLGATILAHKIMQGKANARSSKKTGRLHSVLNAPYSKEFASPVNDGRREDRGDRPRFFPLASARRFH